MCSKLQQKRLVMAKFIAQIIITGTQIVAKAFSRAVKQEFEASQEAARRLGNAKSRSERAANTKLGLSLDEAKQILNIKDLDKKEINEHFEKLFKANDKSNGGSFYIQSKVLRAKERLELELANLEQPKKEDSSPDKAGKT